MSVYLKLEVIGREERLEEADAALSQLEKQMKDLEAALKEAIAGMKSENTDC
jgi:hypothetical protein